MSGPALISVLIGLLTVATLAVRRRPILPYLMGGISSALIGLFVLFAPLDSAINLLGFPVRIESSWQILGRPLSLEAQDRAGVSFLFLVGALFFSLGWAVAPGRSFVPAGLLALGLLAGALTIEPFLFAAILLELAAMACVLVLIPPGAKGERGVLNLLILYSMAMMAILFTGWLLENVGVTSVTPELALRVILLLGLGFVILLFVPPFHYWVPSVARRVNPYSLAFVALILQSSGIFILLRFLDSFAWLRADPRVTGALQAAGVLMIVFGTVVAISQDSFLKVAAYVLLVDIGVSLLAIGSGATTIAIGMTSVRVIGFGLWGLGAALMTGPPESRSRVPIATAAALLGLMSLAGLPLTAGFPWRWSMLAQMPGATELGALLMLLSMLVLTFAGMRWSARLFVASNSFGLKRSDQLALTLLTGMCLLFGVFPQLASPWVAQAIGGLANLSP